MPKKPPTRIDKILTESQLQDIIDNKSIVYSIGSHAQRATEKSLLRTVSNIVLDRYIFCEDLVLILKAPDSKPYRYRISPDGSYFIQKIPTA